MESSVWAHAMQYAHTEDTKTRHAMKTRTQAIILPTNNRACILASTSPLHLHQMRGVAHSRSFIIIQIRCSKMKVAKLGGTINMF